MKKLVAAGAAVLVLLGGSAVAVRQTTDSETCAKPLTILGSEQQASVDVLEAYISENIASKFKNPGELAWASDDYSPTITPARIAARIMLIEQNSASAPRYYHVTVTRDCQGGEWKVTEFKPIQ